MFAFGFGRLENTSPKLGCGGGGTIFIVCAVNLTGGGIFGYETGDFPEDGDPATGERSTTLFLSPTEARYDERLFPWVASSDSKEVKELDDDPRS